MNKSRILLADDHKIVLEGLRGLLEEHFDLAGAATNGQELVEAALRLKPDAIVADISMPVMNGIDAAAEIRKGGCNAPIVFLTMHPDRTYATRALQAGASGYVLKHAASDELVTAIHEVLRGGTYVSPGVDASPGSDGQQAEVTARQKEVLQLLADGKSAKEIGAILDISARTVEAHKYRMMDELGLKTTAQLIQYAIRSGIVSG